MAALVDSAVRARRDVEVIAPPHGGDCSKYLHRMGFHTVVNGFGIDCRLTPVRRHDTGDHLLELTRFASQPWEWEALAERVFRIIDTRLGRRAAERLYAPVAELGANVIDHSWAADGYVAFQHYPRSGELRFAVADGGRGLMSSLGDAHTVHDDAHAIALAAQGGVSGTGEVGRGIGIGIASVIADSRQSGAVTLWSGAAAGTSRSAAPLSVIRCGQALPGTVVAVTLAVV